MKSGLSSRTNVLHLGGALAGIVFAVAAAIAPGKVSAELAEAVAALLLLVFAGAGGYLKADDRKKQARADKSTAGQIVNAKAAKAAAKIGLGVMVAVVAGCAPHWELCEVDLSNHPAKPRPAASARVRCSRTVLCNHADGAVCDGKKLAEVSK